MTDAIRFEVLGRVMLALRESELRSYLYSLDYWRCLDKAWAIEWQNGPYAYEVAAELVRQGGMPDEGVPAVHGLVAPVERADEVHAVVFVQDVRFSLRALSPVGLHVAETGAWDTLRADCAKAQDDLTSSVAG